MMAPSGIQALGRDCWRKHEHVDDVDSAAAVEVEAAIVVRLTKLARYHGRERQDVNDVGVSISIGIWGPGVLRTVGGAGVQGVGADVVLEGVGEAVVVVISVGVVGDRIAVGVGVGVEAVGGAVAVREAFVDGGVEIVVKAIADLRGLGRIEGIGAGLQLSGVGEAVVVVVAVAGVTSAVAVGVLLAGVE